MKNKIEQFASMERDFPGLLLQAQQYLLFRVDMSDVTPAAFTKGQAAFSTLSILACSHPPHSGLCLSVLAWHLNPTSIKECFYLCASQNKVLRSEGFPGPHWPIPSLEDLAGHSFSLLRWFGEGAGV